MFGRSAAAFAGEFRLKVWSALLEEEEAVADATVQMDRVELAQDCCSRLVGRRG
jgi:hypothetical protein